MLSREQIIQQAEANARYYESHSAVVCHDEDGKVNMIPAHMAAGAADALRELIKQIEEYDEVFDVQQQAFTDEELDSWERR